MDSAIMWALSDLRQEPLCALCLWRVPLEYDLSLSQPLFLEIAAPVTTQKQNSRAESGCDNVILEILAAGATFYSFAVAMLYVLLELIVYKTISLSKAAQPLIVAGQLCVS